MIKIKRAYDRMEKGDGKRFLIDGLWPRGVKKEELKVEEWNREVSPSPALRKWFKHDPAKWAEFQKRYAAELKKKPESWKPLSEASKAGNITLLYGARDTEHNNAVVLKHFLEEKKAA